MRSMWCMHDDLLYESCHIIGQYHEFIMGFFKTEVETKTTPFQNFILLFCVYYFDFIGTHHNFM